MHFVGLARLHERDFLPMFIQGLAGVNRRLWDGGAIYSHAQETLSAERRRWRTPRAALAFFQISSSSISS